MSFAALKLAYKQLVVCLRNSTGRDLVDPVSLDEPTDDGTEVDFYRAVLWAYACWFEACQPVGRHLVSIVRNTAPDDFRIVSRAVQDVQNLRTFKAHNLLAANTGDQYKLTQARAWLAQNALTAGEWGAGTSKLCGELAGALNILLRHWERLINSAEDAPTAVERLLNAIDREWAPHVFDRLIETAAEELQLSDFDPVAFRAPRLEDWRKLAELFGERASAEAALARAIGQELLLKFGPAPAHGERDL